MAVGAAQANVSKPSRMMSSLIVPRASNLEFNFIFLSAQFCFIMRGEQPRQPKQNLWPAYTCPRTHSQNKKTKMCPPPTLQKTRAPPVVGSQHQNLVKWW